MSTVVIQLAEKEKHSKNTLDTKANISNITSLESMDYRNFASSSLCAIGKLFSATFKHVLKTKHRGLMLNTPIIVKRRSKTTNN